jgi:hypothetical protein
MRRAQIAFLFVAVVIGGGALLAPLLLSNSESMKGEERSAEAAREIHKSVEAARNEPKVDHAKRFGDWSQKDLLMGVKKELLLKDIVHHVDGHFNAAKPSLWINEESWKDASVGRRVSCASLVWERFFRDKPGNTPLPIFDAGTKRQVATYSRDGGLVDSPSSK